MTVLARRSGHRRASNAPPRIELTRRLVGLEQSSIQVTDPVLDDDLLKPLHESGRCVLADPAAPANAGPRADRRSVRSRASGAPIPTARWRAPPTEGGSGCSAHRSCAPGGHPLQTPFRHSRASDACSRRPWHTLLYRLSDYLISVR